MTRSVLSLDACQRATSARDPRFDGVFFIGVTSTGVYCRPICPARVTHPERRRFFASAAAAERAGFRPCLRCRPELAPGRALCDAVSRLAAAAAQRIAAGALNGRSVADLARELGVSERHLRRALEREFGVSPLELAQTHRLLLAKQLLADTDLTVSRIAYASGFQSLRRFNAVFRERYRMPPHALRDERRAPPVRHDDRRHDLLHLTLAYRPPLAWDALLAMLGGNALPGVELVDGRRYGRTVDLHGTSGVVFVEDATPGGRRQEVVRRPVARRARDACGAAHVNVDVSLSLIPALMPLLGRLRELLDLDAEPAVVDAHLEQGGLGTLVARRPGVRVPGAMDGFELALHLVLGGRRRGGRAAGDALRRIVDALGEPIDTGVPALSRLAPGPDRVGEAGVDRLVRLGVPRGRAETVVALARLVADGALRLEPGADVRATHAALRGIAGVGERVATTIVMRALRWPDAFPATDGALRRAAGAPSTRALLAVAERLRPWRAYAAVHLQLEGERTRST